MKNDFNKASGFYKNIYRKRIEDCMWENVYVKKSKHTQNDWHLDDSSFNRIPTYKSFGDIVYAVIREVYNDTPKPNPVTARATEIVNKACAEAIAESTAVSRPSFFTRMFGAKP